MSLCHITNCLSQVYGCSDCYNLHGNVALIVTRPVFFIFLDYWQVTLIWSPDGDATLIRSVTYW